MVLAIFLNQKSFSVASTVKKLQSRGVITIMEVMKLEVRIGQDRPVIYPLEKEAILVGSSKSCDILVPHQHVSRKHLQITKAGHGFKVEDLGSSNGTFINGERLEERTKVDFTGYFPLSIGTEVQLALVSDDYELDDPQGFELKKDYNEFTRTTVLGKSTAATPAPTKSEVDVPQLTIDRKWSRRLERKKTSSSGPEKGSATGTRNLMILGAAVALSAWWYFQNTSQEVAETSAPAAVVEEAATVRRGPRRQRPAPSTSPTPVSAAARFELPELLTLAKCTTEAERRLCQQFTPDAPSPWGVLIRDERAIVAANISVLFSEATVLLPVPERVRTNVASGREVDEYRQRLWRLSTLMYLKSHLQNDAIVLPPAGLVVAVYTDPQSSTPMAVSELSVAQESVVRRLLRDLSIAELTQPNAELDQQFVFRSTAF